MTLSHLVIALGNLVVGVSWLGPESVIVGVWRQSAGWSFDSILLAQVYRVMMRWFEWVYASINSRCACGNRVFVVKAQCIFIIHFEKSALLTLGKAAISVTCEDVIIELGRGKDPVAFGAFHSRSWVHHLLTGLIQFKLCIWNHVVLQWILGRNTELLCIYGWHLRCLVFLIRSLLFLKFDVIKSWRNHETALLLLWSVLSLLNHHWGLLMGKSRYGVSLELLSLKLANDSIFLLH